MEFADTIRHLRGWPLHHVILQSVLPQLEAGHYDDAALAAFKVVEDQLRTMTNLSGATGQALVDAAFHKQTGLLIDPLGLPSMLEGQYLLFKGAFLLFRNPPAHSFVGMSYSDAVDMIIIANRILLIAEGGYQRLHARRRSSSTTPSIKYRLNSYQDLGPYALDADNDGELEVLIPEFEGGSPFKAYDIRDGRSLRIHVVSVAKEQFYEVIEDMALSDVDNDGLLELICVLGWTANTGFIVYKFRNGQLEPLRMERSCATDYPPVFVDAHIADIDGDGQVEVISVPWESVPEDLIPAHHDSDWNMGRVRYVHKWDRASDRFQLISRELVGFGGR